MPAVKGETFEVEAGIMHPAEVEKYTHFVVTALSALLSLSIILNHIQIWDTWICSIPGYDRFPHYMVLGDFQGTTSIIDASCCSV